MFSHEALEMVGDSQGEHADRFYTANSAIYAHRHSNGQAGGVIERCEFSTCLVEMEVDLSCDRPSVLRNAVRGFWYDAISCLCDLIKTNPQDPS